MPVFNQSRSRIIRLLFLVTFVIIVAQLFHLQVLSGKYKRLAEANAIFEKRIYPTRGIIFDRKGRAILNNTLMFDLMVTPSEVRGIDTALFCRLLEIDTAEFRKRMVDARLKNGPYRPSVFEDLLTPEKYARLDENIWRFGNGFYLQERPVRTYPYNSAAHILGYINEVDTSLVNRSNGFYQPGDYAGRSGLEQYYETVLRGQRGIQYWIKDNKNRLVGRWAGGTADTAAVAGRNLHTYVDIELQQLAEKLLTNKIGAIVALEPKTGGILAMASAPDYNPNDLTGPNKRKNYGRLVLDVSRPLFNRAIKGQYPGGSTYKPLGALIGLDEGVITPASGYPCRGVYYGCNRPLKCTEKFAGHADNLRLAIAWSCNSFFSDVLKKTIDNPAYRNPRIGLTRWKQYCNAFGYGHRLGVDLPSEDGGNIPDTTAYDKEYRGLWNSCTMVGGGLGIGQDKMLVTPLQIANAICIVANKGYYYVPHFVERIDGETDQDTVLVGKFRRKHEVLTHISDSAYNIVMDGMEDVTVKGTAAGIPKIPGISICAKTGTAENKKVIDGQAVKLKDHSLFVCFAPRENPRIAVAVIVENGGMGATWAGPMAYLMVEKYLTDSLRADRAKEADRIAAANLLPSYLTREQFREDSIRAFKWFQMTRDSSYIEKYVVVPAAGRSGSGRPGPARVPDRMLAAWLPQRSEPAKKIRTPHT
ncbi:MAG TPA: penicillin-binding protein 2 [Chitinophagaceae bacterium]|nr:penicillin-binding protein 2 [Chitinophagaceae bacterium]